METTNVMRILKQKKITFETHCVEDAEGLSGVEMAARLGQDKDRVFKTLVTVGKSKHNYVFVIPVAEELDLKKAAKVVGEKSIEMIKSKELLPLTGYIHGGCSPVGMKKVFPTVIHDTATQFETVMFSAGKIGHQIEMNINDLSKVIKIQFDDVVVEQKVL